MNTATGIFHPELFFCNITPGQITCNRMVTTEGRYSIVEDAIRMRVTGEEQRSKRRKKRPSVSPPQSPQFNPFAYGEFSSPDSKGAGGGFSSPVSNGFSYDSPSNRGGKRKKTKKITNSKKRKPKKRTSRKK